MQQDIDFSNNSWLDVANGALALISADLLQSLGGEGTIESKYIHVLMPKALEQVYSILPLDDISQWVQLTRSTGGANIGSSYSYAYDLPKRCATVREVKTEPENSEFQVVKNAVLSNAEAVNIRYISLPSTPEDMPYYAKSLMITLLASMLAGPISHDATMVSALKADYQSQLGNCLAFRKLTRHSDSYMDTGKEWN